MRYFLFFQNTPRPVFILMKASLLVQFAFLLSALDIDRWPPSFFLLSCLFAVNLLYEYLS